MTEDIKPIPALPEGLREAAARGAVIPFVGAGASKIAGCPNWSEFAHSALEFFVSLNKFSHGQLDQIARLHPRIKLSIALQLQKEHKIPIEFRELLYRSQNSRQQSNGRRLYAALSQLGKTFVTTNYDDWLDQVITAPASSVKAGTDQVGPAIARQRSIFHKIEDFTAENLLNGKDAVIHLHGSLLDPKNMVLTTRDYVERYRNDRLTRDGSQENTVLTFLENLFRLRSVLFVGYGLDELEILEYVLLKARARPGERGPHYMVQGFFSHERQLMLSLTSYYRECGIELVPFLRDEKDWDQLIEVLEEFARQAPASDPMQAQKLMDMDELLNG